MEPISVRGMMQTEHPLETSIPVLLFEVYRKAGPEEAQFGPPTQVETKKKRNGIRAEQHGSRGVRTPAARTRAWM
jgi:hypothetical protein